jgi:hypothetical protein
MGHANPHAGTNMPTAPSPAATATSPNAARVWLRLFWSNVAARLHLSPPGEVALKGRVRADAEKAERMENEKQAMQNEK